MCRAAKLRHRDESVQAAEAKCVAGVELPRVCVGRGDAQLDFVECSAAVSTPVVVTRLGFGFGFSFDSGLGMGWFRVWVWTGFGFGLGFGFGFWPVWGLGSGFGSGRRYVTALGCVGLIQGLAMPSQQL